LTCPLEPETLTVQLCNQDQGTDPWSHFVTRNEWSDGRPGEERQCVGHGVRRGVEAAAQVLLPSHARPPEGGPHTGLDGIGNSHPSGQGLILHLRMLTCALA
jgi:hypothetical protein